MFFDHWLVSHRIPVHILTNNGTLFVSEFLATMWALLIVKQFTTTVKHQQTNDLAKRCKNIINVGLHHYVAEHQKDQDTFGHQLSCAFNKQIHRSTNQTQFTFFFNKLPPGSNLLQSKETVPSDAYGNTLLKTIHTRVPHPHSASKTGRSYERVSAALHTKL